MDMTPATDVTDAAADGAVAGVSGGAQWQSSDVNAPLMLANLRESMQARILGLATALLLCCPATGKPCSLSR